MGLVTEYYLDAALQKFEKSSRKAESLWDTSSIREYLEASMNPDYKEGEVVEYTGPENLPSETGVVEDTRPLANLFTGLSPEASTEYKLRSDGRTITVSEDDML